MTYRATPPAVRRVNEAAYALAAVERRAREDREGYAASFAYLTEYGAAMAELLASVAAEPQVLVFCAACAALIDWETTEAVGDGWVCAACRKAHEGDR